MDPRRTEPRLPSRSHLELHQELHARPALPARPPCVVSYWVQVDMSVARADAALAALCLNLGLVAPPAGVRHHVVQASGWTLKFERHGEFASWQVNRPLDELLPLDGGDEAALRERLLETSALTGLPDAFIAELNGDGAGQLLAATHVLMLRPPPGGGDLMARTQRLLAAQAGPSEGDDAASLMGAWVGDARHGALFTNLRLGRDGFTRYVVLDFGLPSDQAAREAQRLCEIEAYRMLAMLGFPLAQREAAQLAALERTLQGTVDAMANDDAYDDHQAFQALMRLAAETEHGAARTRYRFSATRAYRTLVDRRLASLREERIEGVQTLSGFLSRRFEPAMALCESTDRRLTDLAERIHRAASLARVRIEMQREQGNQALLRALARRQKLQVHLQQAVEGLSVVAISYYALGIVGYVAKAAKALPGLHDLSSDVVVGAAAVPVVLAALWTGRRLRRRLVSDEG